MKFTIEVDKIGVGAFALVLILVFGASFVLAQTSPAVGHTSNEINVLIGGQTKTLQQAINANDFGGQSQWTTSGSNIYYNTGKVSVGSSITPPRDFQVRNNNADYTGITLQNNNSRWELLTHGPSGSTSGGFSIWQGGTGSGHHLTIVQGGNVGISNNNPTERLDVNGNIKASGSVSANSFGAITGNSLNVGSGVITGGAISGSSLTSSGAITGGNLQASGRAGINGPISSNGAVALNVGGQIFSTGQINTTGNIVTSGSVTIGNNLVIGSGYLQLPVSDSAPGSCTSVADRGKMYFDSQIGNGNNQMPCICSRINGAWGWYWGVQGSVWGNSGLPCD